MGGVRGRRRTAARREKGGEGREHGGCWEKIGTGSPFNLLINHANEILTGYSEAVLGGGRKALVLDYTLSMWRGGKKREAKYAVEQSDGKLLGPRQPSRTTDSMKGMKHLCWHARTHKNTQRLYTMINLDICIISTRTTPDCTRCNQACNIAQSSVTMAYSYTSALISTNFPM